MYFKKLLCAVLGHDREMLPPPAGVMGGWGGPWRCRRCPAEFAGFSYPPMPKMQPSREDRKPEAVSIALTLDGADEVAKQLDGIIALLRETRELHHDLRKAVGDEALYDFIKQDMRKKLNPDQENTRCSSCVAKSAGKHGETP